MITIGKSLSIVGLTAEKKSPKDSVWDCFVTLSHFGNKVREVPILQQLEHDRRKNLYLRAGLWFRIGLTLASFRNLTLASFRNCCLDSRILFLIEQLAICLRELDDMFGPGVNLCTPLVWHTHQGVGDRE